MNLSRQISENRPVVLFAVLVSCSLISLASGTKPTFIHTGIERLVSITTYPFLKATDFVEEKSSYVSTMVLDYNQAIDENVELRSTLVEMQSHISQQREIRDENLRLRAMLDFQDTHPEYTLTAAQIIEKIEGGYITLDRGERHGVQAPMCVVTKDGVVGIVIDVQDLTCKVATLHQKDCKIGAMVRRSRVRAYDGLVHSDTTFRYMCNMSYIDMKDEVNIGDRVVASPESIFPAGWPIGRIVNVYEGESLWKYADVEPFVDPYQLDEVYLLEKALPKVEDLAGLQPNDALLTQITPTHAPTVPDMRPLQEQLAP